MNPVWAHPLGWALVHSLWQLGVLVLCYRAATVVVEHRPRVRYAAGISVLGMALLAFVATFAWQRSAGRSPQATELVETVPIEAATRTAGETARAVEIPASRASDLAASVVESQLGSFVLLWLVGLAFVGYQFRRSYERSRALRSMSRPIESRYVLECLERARARMSVRRAVEVAECDAIDTPVVVGWRRPRILVPAAFARSLSSDHIEAVFAHELAHVARRDYPVNLLQSLVERWFFFHPGSRYLSREIRDAREQCCDDLAAAASGCGPVEYARALVRLEEIRVEVVPGVALAASDGDLLRRVTRLLDRSGGRASTDARATKHRWVRALSLVTCALLLLASGVYALRATMTVSTVLSGLDPVHLAEGSEVAGSPSTSLHVDGYRYLFAGPETMARFLATPERYTVRNRHFCPITGDRVRPDVWQVVGGRPVLFCCPMANAPQMRHVVQALALPPPSSASTR